MDNGGSNNRGFVCGHGDDLACSSPSHHQQALKSLWAPAHRPPFHDPSSSPPKAYFDMPAPLHRNTRRRPRGRPLIHNINEEYIEVVPDETNTDPEPDCSYDEPITSQVLSGKKRRLTAEQVQFLERSFEVEKKVDPERKTRLARELGLEPRQVAIWFQNRRARYKTKSIEREFDGLRNRYDKLKGEYETVLKEKENLQDQVSALTAKLKLSKTSDSAPSPLTTYTNTDASTHQTPVVSVKTAEVKQEEAASSAKSDVLDSDSSPPRCSDGGGAAAKCNYYHYYYNSSSPVPEMVEEEESEEYQLTRSLFPPAPPPAPYDGFHRQDGGCNGFGMSAGVDVEVEPRPSSLWPWFY